MFAASYFATRYFATDYFGKIGAAVGEVLGLGDLTTALSEWLRGVGIDRNTNIRDRLASYGPGSLDATTRLALFLRSRG